VALESLRDDPAACIALPASIQHPDTDFANSGVGSRLIGQRRFSTSIAVIRGFQWYSILYGSGFTRLDSIWIDPEVVKFPDFGFGV
jgi:hypothetical protein